MDMMKLHFQKEQLLEQDIQEMKKQMLMLECELQRTTAGNGCGRSMHRLFPPQFWSAKSKIGTPTLNQNAADMISRLVMVNRKDPALSPLLAIHVSNNHFISWQSHMFILKHADRKIKKNVLGNL